MIVLCSIEYAVQLVSSDEQRRQADPAAAAAEGAAFIVVLSGQVDGGLAEVADGEQGSGSERMALCFK